jgi:hypothetical protein
MYWGQIEAERLVGSFLLGIEREAERLVGGYVLGIERSGGETSDSGDREM